MKQSINTSAGHRLINFKEKYGEWAIITGASSGIGKTFAFKLSDMGMNILLIARREDKLVSIRNEINQKGKVIAEHLTLDLTQEGSSEKLFEYSKDKEIGILIINAGIASSGKFSEVNANYDKNMVQLHCVTPLQLSHLFISKMKKQNKGAIIFIGSLLGHFPTPFSSVYSATKSFTLNFACSLSHELKKYNIDVLAVSPGSTKTEMRTHINKRFEFLVRSPEKVVDTALNKLGEKYIVIDGLHNKIINLIINCLPNKLATDLVGKYLAKFK